MSDSSPLFDPLTGYAFDNHHGIRVSHFGIYCLVCKVPIGFSTSSLQRHLKKHRQWVTRVSLKDMLAQCKSHMQQLNTTETRSSSILETVMGHCCVCGEIFKTRRALVDHCRHSGGVCNGSSATRTSCVTTVCCRLIPGVETSDTPWNSDQTAAILQPMLAGSMGVRTYTSMFHGLAYQYRENLTSRLVEMVN